MAARTTGVAGLTAFSDGFTTGNVATTYPIEATLTSRPKDSFRDAETANGTTIIIGSSFRLLPGATLDTAPAQLGSVGLDGIFGAFVGTEVRLCIFVCLTLGSVTPGTNSAPFAFNIPTTTANLITVDTTQRIDLGPVVIATQIVDEGVASISPLPEPLGGFLGPNVAAIADVIAGGIGRENTISLLASYIANFTLIGNFSGHLGLPAVQTTSRTSGTSLIAQGSDNFVNPDIDLDGILSPVPLGFTLFPLCLPGGSPCASFSYNIIGINNEINLTQEETFELTTRPRVKLTFPSAVPFTVSSCDRADAFTYRDPDNPIAPGPSNKSVKFIDPSDLPGARTGLVNITDGIQVPENSVICSGESNIVVFDLGDRVDIDFPIGADVTNVSTEYLLPNLLDNTFNTRFQSSFRFTALALQLGVSGFEIIPRITLIPEICFGILGCTPELVFPGLSSPAIDLDLGPVLDETVTLLDINDAGFFDSQADPWILDGFNSVPGDTFILDPQRKASAVFSIGPTALLEVQVGTWDCNGATGSDSRDIAEDFTCEWDFGDGIGASGKSVTHFYEDNKGAPGVKYTVTRTVDDGHERPQVITRYVNATNVRPTLIAGTNKTTFEGTPIGLGSDLFGRNLIKNGRAEQGLDDWNPVSLATDTYASSGSARPFTDVIVNNSTQGFYNDGIGQVPGRQFLCLPRAAERSGGLLRHGRG